MKQSHFLPSAACQLDQKNKHRRKEGGQSENTYKFDLADHGAAARMLAPLSIPFPCSVKQFIQQSSVLIPVNESERRPIVNYTCLLRFRPFMAQWATQSNEVNFEVTAH